MNAVLAEKSLFPARVAGQGYGLFGYEGMMCDMAIWRDNAEQIEEAVKRGWIVPGTETFDGMKLVKVARKRGSESVAKKLIELGWADEKWPHPAQTSVVWGMDGQARSR
ncbi:MAG: hypothetical protein ACYC2K_01670 [Gemmatimonadales bacterium]